MQRTKLEAGIDGFAITCMSAEVVAVDAVALAFSTARENAVVGERIVTAQGSLPALVDMVVLVMRGIVAKQDELVGVSAVSECGGGALAEILLRGGKPRLRAFPRREVAIELVGTEGRSLPAKITSVCPRSDWSRVSEDAELLR